MPSDGSPHEAVAAHQVAEFRRPLAADQMRLADQSPIAGPAAASLEPEDVCPVRQIERSADRQFGPRLVVGAPAGGEEQVAVESSQRSGASLVEGELRVDDDVAAGAGDVPEGMLAP